MKAIAKIVTGSSGGFYLGPRSLLRLRGVHPDLRAVVKYALHISASVDFAVVCGLRTLERQKELFARGASHTMDSRHLTGHAVDLAPYVGKELCWSTLAFGPLVELMKRSAHILQVPLVCGADYNNAGTTGSRWRDFPHFELPKGIYHYTDMTSHSEMAQLWV